MSRHMKRLAAPRAWKIKRKEKPWTVKPSAGPHRTSKSLPLLLVVRDVLKYANTGREARKIINEGKIIVNKVPRKDFKFPVGLMDVLEIPITGEHKIMLIDRKGTLIFKDISEGDSRYKLYKIVGKTLVKKGGIQLNLHDGRNLLIRVKDPTKPKEDIYKINDTLVLDVKDNTIKKHLPFKEGSTAFITGGKHRADVAKIKEVKITRSPMPNPVTLSKEGGDFQTVADYIFVIGEKKPELGVFE